MIVLSTLLTCLSITQAQAEPELDPTYVTGDELYDRMQLEVLLEHGAELGRPSYWDSLMSEYNWHWAPHSSVVTGWEAEFAERSDYWCLLLFCRMQESPGSLPEMDILRHAASCRDAPPAVFRMLMFHELREIREDQSLDAWQQDSAADAIINRYLAMFPESAWPCYEAADHLAWFGNSRRFVELLELGNRLTQLEEQSIYPFSLVQERIHKDGNPGSPAVAGSLLRSGAYMPSLEFMRLIQRRDVYKNMIVGGTELGMARGLTALMRRDLLDSAASSLPQLCGGANASIVTLPGLIADYSNWPDAQQAAGVERFLADIDTFRERMQTADERLEAFDPELAA